MATLTDKTLARTLREARLTGKDVAITDAIGGRGGGSLRFRARPSGLGIWYFRYTNSAGQQDQVTIGNYDPGARSGLTLREARDKAGELSRLYQAGKRDLRQFIEHQNAEGRARIEEARREREEAERTARSGTLQALLDGYVEYLDIMEKASTRDVRNILRFNVSEALPHVAAMKANQITSEDVSAILAKCVERGAGRTAGKLRSYLRAAYTLAIQARSDPTVPAALHGFEISANPAAAVPAKSLAKFNRARDRVLNAAELKAYMNELDKLPAGMTRTGLWLGLLLGGQRMRQLLRLRPIDVDLDAGTVTLYDAKGNRRQPRAHVLPLTASAAEQLAGALAINAGAAYVLSNGGRVPVRTETLSAEVTAIATRLVTAGIARASFEMRDIRRTCETMLAAMGVSRDVRAQLQSHGLGGVQNRHYDRHEYMAEKRQALEAWERRLDEIKKGTAASNVIDLPRKLA